MKPTHKPSTNNVNGPRPPHLAGPLGITAEPVPAIDIPATVVVDVTPAVILRSAALYLDKHGWHQGALYADEDPTNLTPAACAQGGIGMAAFGCRIPQDAALNKSAEWRDFKCASDFFDDYLTLTGAKPAAADYPDGWDAPSVGDWNDDRDRTFDQVHAALLAAADEYERTHAPLPVLDLPGGENA